jgi:ParG
VSDIPTESIQVKRMNVNVEAGLHDAFKAATAARGQNMTDVLLEFIEEYVRKNLPGGLKGKKEGRR